VCVVRLSASRGWVWCDVVWCGVVVSSDRYKPQLFSVISILNKIMEETKGGCDCCEGAPMEEGKLYHD